MILLRQFLFLHWRGVRWGLLPFVLASFGLPLLAVQGLVPGPESRLPDTVTGAQMLSGLQAWLPLFPLLSSITGATLALSAWNWDHRGDHVYALSLPLPRWEYVLLKMGAGAALLLVPVVAFWLGSLLATTSLPLPEGLRAYPSAVAGRFFLTALVVYAILFAFGAGTLRTAIWILLTFAVLSTAGGAMLDFLLGPIFPELGRFRFLDWFVDSILTWPGPFEVLTGSWMLIDV